MLVLPYKCATQRTINQGTTVDPIKFVHYVTCYFHPSVNASIRIVHTFLLVPGGGFTIVRPQIGNNTCAAHITVKTFIISA